MTQQLKLDMQSQTRKKLIIYDLSLKPRLTKTAAHLVHPRFFRTKTALSMVVVLSTRTSHNTHALPLTHPSTECVIGNAGKDKALGFFKEALTGLAAPDHPIPTVKPCLFRIDWLLWSQYKSVGTKTSCTKPALDYEASLALTARAL